jgi:predicted nucleic acid-binding protein
LRVIADTGPLVAAANSRDEAHGLAAALVTELGRDLIILDAVIVEVDHLLRSRVGSHAARLFLQALVAGEHSVVFITPALFRRATQFDTRYARLDLGVTDAAIMAYAERHRLPILTFDFQHFRATQPVHGYWRLVIDERRYRKAIDFDPRKPR